MRMEMNLEQLFKMIAKSARESNEDNEEEVLVGKIPRHIAYEFARYRREADAFEKEVDLEKQRMVLELEQKLADKFDSRADLLQESHDHVWEMIYGYLNLNPQNSYYLQKQTGKVYMRLDGKDKDASPFVKNDNNLH